MDFNPFDVTVPHIAYACLGGFVVLFGMFSLFLREKLYIGEACWAFVFGVIIGPYGANIFNPHKWGDGSEETTNIITLEFTRVVLAIGVFAIGVELPKAYMARHWKSLFFLLVPVMTWGWFVSAGLIYALIPGLNFLSSLAIGACLTPTDPILAAAVVGGKWADKHVPAHLRHLLAAESGCNDGAAFPFLFISLYLILDSPDIGVAIRDWFLILWLYQVILGIVIGALVGFSFRHLMKFCQRHNLIDRHSYVAQYLSLAMLTNGITVLLGSDDLLAAFACGTAFAWDGFFNRQTEEAVFSSVIDLLFNIAAFVYVGAWMPFSAFQNAETTLSVWRLVVIAILVLLLRRLPVMIALYRWIPDVKSFREAIFSGHFGPIGIGAVFISTLANEAINKDKHPHNEQVALLSDTIQPIVAFMVLCSITIHGLSIPSFSLGRRVHSVSRTWSRHAPPDWTNQATMVERGGDGIVINRDSVMERGELTEEGKAPDSRTLTSESPSIKEDDKDGNSEETEKAATLAEGKPDTPPDGQATEIEWLEPHRRIIERRPSPGEDVEVEVVNEENSNPQSLVSQIRQSLHLLDGLKKSAGHLQDQAGDLVEHKVEEIELHVKEVLDNNAAGPSGQNRTDDHDEEAWASEASESDPGSASLAGTSTSNENKRSKPRSTTRSQPVGSVRLGKQRRPPPPPIPLHVESPSPTGTTTPASYSRSQSPTPPEQNEYEYDDARGRSQTHAHFASHFTRPHSMSPGPSTRAGHRPRAAAPDSNSGSILRPTTADSAVSLRNNRVNHIRALHSSPPTREVSPSRSVRFFDESPRSPPPERENTAPGLGEEGEGKNKVKFDVPPSPAPGGKG